MINILEYLRMYMKYIFPACISMWHLHDICCLLCYLVEITVERARETQKFCLTNRQNLILTTMRRNAFTQLRRKANTSSRLKHTLVLVRHGESTWNQENKFTGTLQICRYFFIAVFYIIYICAWHTKGWYDCPLSSKGQSEASKHSSPFPNFIFVL